MRRWGDEVMGRWGGRAMGRWGRDGARSWQAGSCGPPSESCWEARGICSPRERSVGRGGGGMRRRALEAKHRARGFWVSWSRTASGLGFVVGLSVAGTRTLKYSGKNLMVIPEARPSSKFDANRMCGTAHAYRAAGVAGGGEATASVAPAALSAAAASAGSAARLV
eukprot:6849579-Prymnesium_polylepis.2